MPPVSAPPPGWTPGEPAHRRITFALFLAGLATFALVYCTQPLLPLLADAFGVSPATSTLALSVTTISMGAALLVFGPLSDALGRLTLMRVTLLVAALIAVASAFAPTWGLLLLLRGALGFAVAGLPAVATAYLREEIHGDWATAATGLYIGGTAIGGMSGRLLTGLLAEAFGWQAALAGIAAMALAIAVALGVLLPPARRFVPTPLNRVELADNARRMLLDRGLLTLYALGFCAMGAFVAAFNGLSFRLVAPPFDLGVGVASLVFVTYLIGSFSSPWAGRLAARFGSRTVVPVALAIFAAGVALTLVDHLTAVVGGVGLITFGFFAAHGTTSGWVTARAASRGRGTGMAGSLYLAFYYTGSSVCGALAGQAWSMGRWPAVAALTGGLVLVAIALAVSMRRVPVVPARPYDQPQP
ncbi:MFS transporter [Propioniciclava coleopterorum]|uniref:MFS transporter n=1 Tax=Propioniciclava coleopterorum TaxID=2714937 RepID=A0A6G7Y742_9ACTN|nr:MFS transporter [Propioniciclava coleopterorum]QIK72714.1 MFS transporter [Propioniciclava coleopterorum]